MPPNDTIETRVALVEQALMDVQRALTGHVERFGIAMDEEKTGRVKTNDVWRTDIISLNLELRALSSRINIGIGILLTLQLVAPIILLLVLKGKP